MIPVSEQLNGEPWMPLQTPLGLNIIETKRTPFGDTSICKRSERWDQNTTDLGQYQPQNISEEYHCLVPEIPPQHLVQKVDHCTEWKIQSETKVIDEAIYLRKIRNNMIIDTVIVKNEIVFSITRMHRGLLSWGSRTNSVDEICDKWNLGKFRIIFHAVRKRKAYIVPNQGSRAIVNIPARLSVADAS
jgi:hypothetical protein